LDSNQCVMHEYIKHDVQAPGADLRVQPLLGIISLKEAYCHFLSPTFSICYFV